MGACRLTSLAAYIAVNVACSVVLVLVSKRVYTVWPFPLTAVTVQQVLTWVITYTRTQDSTQIAGAWYLGVMFAAGIAGTNVLLQHVSVGIYELVKALCVPSLVLVQYHQYKVKEDARGALVSAAIVAFMVAGTVHATFATDSASAVAVGVVAVLASATHKATVKACIRQHNVKPDVVLAAHMPASCVCLVAATLALETPSRPQLRVSAAVVLVGVAGVIMNVTAVRIMNDSPMLYQNLGPVKSFLLVTLAAAWGDALQSVCIVGAAVCAALYVRVRKKSTWDHAPVRSLEYLDGVKQPRFVRTVFVLVSAYIMYNMDSVSRDDNYRLGDLIPINGHVHDLTCNQYPNTMACAYKKLNTTGEHAFTGVVLDFARATVVHARVGDALYGPDCWNNEQDCLSGCYCLHDDNNTYDDRYCQHTCAKRRLYALPKTYYDNVFPPRDQSIIILYGHHISTSLDRDAQYIDKMTAYWKSRGYVTHAMQGCNADRDLLMMAKAPVFVQAGGGYSGLSAKANLAMQGRVLVAPHFMHCPQDPKNRLCKVQ